MNKLAAGLFAAVLAASTAVRAEVVASTGAGYIPMLKALAAQYEDDTGRSIKLSFGGHIGSQLAQIKEGSKINVVISDAASLKRFTDAVDLERRRDLGSTPLVLIWRKGLTLSSPEDAASESVKTLAYPDPRAAIYGRAADDWLAEKGLKSKLDGRVRIVSSVPQTVAYVSQGEMDAGFVNLYAARSAAEKIGGSIKISDMKEPIVMTAVPVAGKADEEGVEQFLEYLEGERAAKLMEKFGVVKH